MLTWLGDSETPEAVSTAERRCPRTQRLMRHLWRPVLAPIAGSTACDVIGTQWYEWLPTTDM